MTLSLTIERHRRHTVNLSGVTQITDPTTGDERFRAINIFADGSGSSVNLSSRQRTLRTTTPAARPAVKIAPRPVTPDNSGLMTVSSANTLLIGVAATAQTSGTIAGNLQLAAQSALTGNGTVAGSVENGGTVQPGTSSGTAILTITGVVTANSPTARSTSPSAATTDRHPIRSARCRRRASRPSGTFRRQPDQQLPRRKPQGKLPGHPDVRLAHGRFRDLQRALGRQRPRLPNNLQSGESDTDGCQRCHHRDAEHGPGHEQGGRLDDVQRRRLCPRSQDLASPCPGQQPSICQPASTAPTP